MCEEEGWWGKGGFKAELVRETYFLSCLTQFSEVYTYSGGANNKIINY